MRRMFSDELKLKSVKVADDQEEVIIPKEAFTKYLEGYYVNIKSINQSAYDGIGPIVVNVNDEVNDAGMIRNCTHTIGMYPDSSDVIVTIIGVILDQSDNSIKSEMTFTIQNTTIEEALESTVLIGAAEFDLYIIKN